MTQRCRCFALLMSALVLDSALASVAARQAQTEADEYTRYELLEPDSAKFRILYDVTATTPGARFYFNPIRKGSVATDEAVLDAMTGTPIKFEIVPGAEARAGGHPTADLDTSYIKVHLGRPVPAEGEARLLIDKTYQDAKSYFREGNLIVFSRSLGINRNAVVLPAGYELVSCNFPSQVLTEPTGRIAVSFMNAGPGAVPLLVQAKRRPSPPSPSGRDTQEAVKSGSSDQRVIAPATSPGAVAPAPVTSSTGRALTFPERARQDREIVYFLNAPDTHSFRLYHDYTETREGTDKYLNIVRQGSTVSNPSARILDTGERLRIETLKGDAISRARIDIGEPVRPETEVVVIRFAPVGKGQSVRLRIEETYTDPGRYRLVGDELVWHRSLGRPRNAVVLPVGWYLTASSIPAVVSETTDGRIRLDYVNPRPDEIDVLLKAKRRSH